ncbi:hypothetical protein TWF481_003329 [Arthrobotrys musiformis]|uniref:Ankyrin repeat protein n=1 Tax=Arthrobotrys musiformis TaxID=47236 RepID=A0AAV9VS16_9PEZI
MRRHIPISVMRSLPIWNASQYLKRFTESHPFQQIGDEDSVAAQMIPSYYPLLRTIIYRISNNIIGPENGADHYHDVGYDCYICDGFEEIYGLLDKVEELKARAAFQKLLSSDSVSIIATCEALALHFYRRRDYDMLKSIRQSHPEIRVNLYKLLAEDYTRYSYGMAQGFKIYMGRVLRDLEADGSPPTDESEAYALLFTCREVRGNLDLFFQLWSPEEIPVEWIDRSDVELQSLALCTDDPEELNLLLAFGFNSGARSLLLRAVMRGKLDRERESTKSRILTLAIDMLFFEALGDDLWDLEYLGTACFEQNTLREQVVSTLEVFLELGAEINRTELWRVYVWPILTGYVKWGEVLGAAGTEILRILLEAGADPEIELHNIPQGFLENLMSQSERARYGGEVWGFDLWFMMFMKKPIDVLFLLEHPSPFCTLLKSSKLNVDGFISKVTTRKDQGLEIYVLPEFLRALCLRDLDLINELWGGRFETTQQRFLSAFRNREIDTVKAILLRYISSYRLPVFVFILARASMHLESLSEYYNEGIGLLHWLLEQGADFKLFEAILSFVSRPESQNISRCAFMLQKTGIDFAVEAAKSKNSSFLRCLVERGFDINRSETLRAAVAEGDLQTSSHLLQQGADIITDAIEAAVIFGRIDVVALFLAVEPGCYDLMLGSARRWGAHNPKARYRFDNINGVPEYIIRFIENWKQQSERGSGGVQDRISECD